MAGAVNLADAAARQLGKPFTAVRGGSDAIGLPPRRDPAEFRDGAKQLPWFEQLEKHLLPLNLRQGPIIIPRAILHTTPLHGVNSDPVRHTIRWLAEGPP